MREKIQGPTSLIGAAMEGHIGIVRVLIEAGADVSIKDNKEKTALSWAESKGHNGIIKLLKDYENVHKKPIQ